MPKSRHVGRQNNVFLTLQYLINVYLGTQYLYILLKSINEFYNNENYRCFGYTNFYGPNFYVDPSMEW